MSTITASLREGLCNAQGGAMGLIETAGGPMLTIYAWVNIGALILTALLGALYHLLRRWSKPYAALSPEQKVVTTFHCAMTLLYAGCLGPMTYYGMQLVFFPVLNGKAELQQFVQNVFVPALILMNLNSVAYIAEAGARTIVKTNWVLLLHHSMFHTLYIIAIMQRDTLALKHGITLNVFAMYETGLFATLAARRLQLPHKIVVGSWWIGMGLYTVTRIAQAIILVWLFVVAYAPLSRCGKIGMWWGNLVMFLVFSVVQLYTFPLYIGVLKRSLAAAKRTVKRVGSSLHRFGSSVMHSLSMHGRSRRHSNVAEAMAGLSTVAEEGESEGAAAGLQSEASAAKSLESGEGESKLQASP